MSKLEQRRQRQRSLTGVLAAVVLLMGMLATQPFAGASEGSASSSTAASVIALPPQVGRAFTDVGPGHPFETEIGWMVDAGLATGFPDGSFRPTVAVSRQATAAFLFRFDGIAPRAVPTPPECTEPAFTDVGVDHPFCGEISWLVAEAIAGGFADGSFRPTDAVSRQAAAAFLHRFAGEPEPPAIDNASFTDVPLDHPFSDAIEWAVEVGITTGFPDGTFKPTDSVSRQAMAAFLYRYLTEFAGVDPTPTTTTTVAPTTTSLPTTTTTGLPTTTTSFPIITTTTSFPIITTTTSFPIITTTTSFPIITTTTSFPIITTTTSFPIITTTTFPIITTTTFPIFPTTTFPTPFP
ncbi:MAG: S-layer homology domain-containing protein [Acidimicrobiia bacterium]|nr:S-layer homology domain-containing protein [Acidimicrobiia bacterium]